MGAGEGGFLGAWPRAGVEVEGPEQRAATACQQPDQLSGRPLAAARVGAGACAALVAERHPAAAKQINRKAPFPCCAGWPTCR